MSSLHYRATNGDGEFGGGNTGAVVQLVPQAVAAGVTEAGGGAVGHGQGAMGAELGVHLHRSFVGANGGGGEGAVGENHVVFFVETT